MEISRLNRWMLSNQHRILAKLYPEQAAFHNRSAEALERGYESEYHEAAKNISEAVLADEECKEVLEILGMFSELQKHGLVEHNFCGFWANGETKQIDFASFVEDRFPDLHRPADWNSGGPMLHRYQQMLREWRKLPRDQTPTAEMISKVVTAASDSLNEPEELSDHERLRRLHHSREQKA